MENDIAEMINDMFESYMEDGFDFDSDMSFTEVFHQVFSNAVMMTIELLESAEEEEIVESH